MKNLIILLTLMLLFLFAVVKAQQIIDSGTKIPAGVTVQQAKSGNLNLYKRTTFTPPLRLAVHIVRYSNGTGGITSANLTQKIDSLNGFMAQAHFQFYIHSIDYIDSDYFADINTEQKANELRLINVIDDCINVYFVPVFFLNGISSFSPRIQDPSLQCPQGIVIWNNAPSTTLPHEMGHYFDLFHPEETYFGFENIDRDGPCANWDSTGDLLGDTPADPSLRVIFTTFNQDCQWINPPLKPLPPDGCGQRNYNPLTNNLMQIMVDSRCRTTLTENQKNRMNETLIIYRSELLKPFLVYLKNSINSTNAGGTLHIGSNNYKSGRYVAVNPGIHRMGTNNERFTNFQGSGFNYKHNNWNLLSSDFSLSRNVDIVDHIRQVAYFNKLEPAKIRLYLEGNLLAGFGAGSFRDPWYLLSNGSQPSNYWINFTSEYEPTGREAATEKGVFLNQGYNPITNVWSPPYYSVRAISPQPVTINGRTHNFYFQNWSASPTDSVEFQNANALEIGVVFKES